MTADIERFMSSGQALADVRNLPTGQGQWQQHYSTGEARTIVLGRMLAQVAIVPMGNRCSVIGVDGDPEMLAAITTRSDGGTLRIEGGLPFKPGGGNGPFRGTFFSGGNVTMTVGSVGGSFYSSGGGRSTFIIDGREVDLDRYIRLVLAVPPSANVQVRNLVGVAGITGDLDGDLDFSPSYQAELVTAGRVGSLTGDITGSGSATVAAVDGDADIDISGSGSLRIGAAGGVVDARIAGSGNVSIDGGVSTRLRASVSGSGHVDHRGEISGDARLRVSGSGQIYVSTVFGSVDASVSGSGSISANGKTYRPRW